MAASVERARELYEASAQQDYKHAVEALERLKNPPKPEAAKPAAGKSPEKKERKPEKGGFLKSLFGGKK